MAERSEGLRQPRVEVLIGTSQGRATAVLDLESVRLVDDSGGRTVLPLVRRRLDSAAGGGRVLVAGGVVPESSFTALELVVRGAWLREGTALRPLLLLADGQEGGDPAGEAGVVVAVPISASARPRDSLSLFLVLDVDASLRTGLEMLPTFRLEEQEAQARLGMLYVADRAADLVLAVDRGGREVTTSFSAGARPAALDLSRDRRYLCVANQGDGSATVLDVLRGERLYQVPIRFGAGTSDVEIVEGLGQVAVTNPEYDSVTVFELDGGARIGDVRVGRRPVRLVGSQRHRRLYVLNHEDDTLSVVDLNTLTVVTTLATRASPSYVVLDVDEEVLAVGHLRSPDVLLIDARTLQLESSVSVGDRVTAMAADPARSRFYVARRSPRELVVVDRGLATVTRRLPLSADVTGLVRPKEGARLYGAAPEAGGLLVLDLVLGREEPLIPCGREPVDVLVSD